MIVLGVISRLIVVSSAFIVLALWMLALAVLMIAIHEPLHYLGCAYHNLDPEFRISRGSFSIPSPSVTPMTTGIKLRENALGTAPPFVGVNLLALVVIASTDGLVAGSAAWVLLINSASSAQDLYHLYRYWKLPSATLFANWERNGELRTEYTFPISNAGLSARS